MKRKIKVHGKINLMETSAVGIPAYPYAHASSNLDSFSLIKALSNANLKPETNFVDEGEEISDQLNLEENETETMEEKSQTAEIKKQEEDEEKPSEDPEDEAEKKPDMSEIIAKAIKEGIKDGLKELETERGVVEKQHPINKSLGEMAIEQGLFVK